MWPRKAPSTTCAQRHLPASCVLLVEKQSHEQARELGISEEAVVKEITLNDRVDGDFTTTADVAQAALLFAAFEANALTG